MMTRQFTLSVALLFSIPCVAMQTAKLKSETPKLQLPTILMTYFYEKGKDVAAMFARKLTGNSPRHWVPIHKEALDEIGLEKTSQQSGDPMFECALSNWRSYYKAIADALSATDPAMIIAQGIAQKTLPDMCESPQSEFSLILIKYYNAFLTFARDQSVSLNGIEVFAADQVYKEVTAAIDTQREEFCRELLAKTTLKE